jgi:hypothetical protein
MDASMAFILIVLVILVILVAHVFACERADGALSLDEPLGGKTGGASFTHQLLPAGKGPHTHLAALSPKGDGTSTTDFGHLHAVREFKVRPGPDGHFHDITQYIVPSLPF